MHAAGSTWCNLSLTTSIRSALAQLLLYCTPLHSVSTTNLHLTFLPNKQELLLLKIKGTVLLHPWVFAPCCICVYVPTLCTTINPVRVMNWLSPHLW